MISKIDKAHRYAQEPERVSIATLDVNFHGGHDTYQVHLAEDHWACSCHTYGSLGTCSHIMAMQELLGVMLSNQARLES